MGNLLRRLLRWLSGRPDKVMYIGGSDTLPQPLPRQEEAEWISRLEQGELLARQTLIERNLRLVVYIARRFENTGSNIEDLIEMSMRQNFVPVVDDEGIFIGIIRRRDIIKDCYQKSGIKEEEEARRSARKQNAEQMILQ